MDYASEFRYRDPVVSKKTLAIAITQSGETADTVAALREARVRGARTLAICNSVGSEVTRLAEGVLFTHAGLEMGVASTKSFSTQLAVLTLLAVHLGRSRGTFSAEESAAVVAGLRAIPGHIEHVHSLERELEALAREWQATPNALYLGRGPLYPVALEGALKLKEISYIHAQGFPGGEMKHGPIALIDAEMPVVALLPNDVHRERMLSNLQEAAARGAPIIAFVSEGEHALDSLARTVIRLPSVHPSLAPILYTIPLQLFAYHVAVLRGCDVDRPRNFWQNRSRSSEVHPNSHCAVAKRLRRRPQAQYASQGTASMVRNCASGRLMSSERRRASSGSNVQTLFTPESLENPSS